MRGALYDFFERDHRRLEMLLDKAIAPEDGFDMEAYTAFRQGLLSISGWRRRFSFPPP